MSNAIDQAGGKPSGAHGSGQMRSVQRATGWLRRKMPSREEMAESRYLAPIAHRFLSPELWRFTRRSVPRGVALGLFAAFIVPLGQIFLAAFMALPARANMPLAAAVTFVTNPFTVPFWLLAANRVGGFVLKIDAVAGGGTARAEIESGRWESFGWFLQTAGVTAFGFVVLAIVTAALGYIFAAIFWRAVVLRRRAQRLSARKARASAERSAVNLGAVAVDAAAEAQGSHAQTSAQTVIDTGAERRTKPERSAKPDRSERPKRQSDSALEGEAPPA